MDALNRYHAVTNFVSVDAPQRGAVIDQNFQQHLISNGCLPTGPSTCIPPTEWPLDVWGPAGQQLMQVNQFDTSQPTDHQQFFTELRALNGGRGYPHLTTNVGVSFGTLDVNNPDPGDRWAEFVYPFLPNDNFFVTGPLAGPGSFLPEALGRGWKRVWRFWAGVNRTAHPTFIPFDSALDRTTPPATSPFQPPLIYPAVPSFHDVVPPTLFTPLLNRLGYLLPAPTSVSISGPSTLAIGQTGTWTASTPAGNAAGYHYTWDYRIFFPGCTGGGGSTTEGFPSLDGPELDPEGAPLPGDGGGGTDRVTCGVWHRWGFRPTFTRSESSDTRMDLWATARDDDGTVSQTISVCIGNCSWDARSAGAADTKSTQPESPGRSAVFPTAVARDAASFTDGLETASPNPVRGGRTTIRFSLSEASPVHLVVYDVTGRGVAVLADGTRGPTTWSSTQTTFRRGCTSTGSPQGRTPRPVGSLSRGKRCDYDFSQAASTAMMQISPFKLPDLAWMAGLTLLALPLSSCGLLDDPLTVVEGVVVDVETGEPLPDISVFVFGRLFPGGADRAATTDSSGRFRLEWPADSFNLEQVDANVRWDFPVRGRVYPYTPSYSSETVRTPEGKQTVVRIALTPMAPTP